MKRSRLTTGQMMALRTRFGQTPVIDFTAVLAWVQAHPRVEGVRPDTALQMWIKVGLPPKDVRRRSRLWLRYCTKKRTA